MNVEAKDTTNGIEIFFNGIIDEVNPGVYLIPMFDEIHNKVVSNKVKIVELNLKGLDFLNSSGIRALIQWISKTTKIQESERYNVIVKINKDILWQDSLASMLKSFDNQYLTVERI